MQPSCVRLYRNLVALWNDFVNPPPTAAQLYKRLSGLALPAWKRVALTLPALALLWLGVWWASLEAAPL